MNTVQEAARQIVTDLGDRSIHFPMDDTEVMDEIYQEIVDTINTIKTNVHGGLFNE